MLISLYNIYLDALIFHRHCFFNSTFGYDQPFGFGNRFDVVDQLSDGSIIEIYRIIFQGIEAYQHFALSELIRTGLDLSLFLFFNNLFDFSNLF